MVIKLLRAGVVIGAVAGCTVGPNYEPTSVWSPAGWFASNRPAAAKVASEPVAAPVDIAWWTAFHDPVLTGLIERAAGANLDVRSATARVAQARAQRGVNAAAEFPQINGNSSATRQRLSRNGAASIFSGGAGGGAPGTAANGLGGAQGGAIPTSRSIPAFDLFQGGLDASYELDLWGRVRRSIESADASLVASNEARRSALITTTAEVARTYLQLRNAQAQLAIARSNLATARESANLTDARSRGGLATDLDVANARGQQEATAATIPALEQQEAQGINAIGLLLALPPAALAAELTPRPVPAVPPTVPVGLPSELARRRPDIRQAEAQLHAATADIGVAEADFYPRITLTGSVSLQTTQVKSLFNAASAAYAFGPSLSVPIFDGARIRRTVELREGQQQEAAIQYQRVVLQAFTDVDNALIAYNAEQRRRGFLLAQVAQGRRALGLAQSRYRQGVSDFLEVLTAQRTVLAAEQQAADSQAVIGENLVALYKALGGGWEQAYPE